MSRTTEEIKYPLKFLVDKERKKVIFAEAENAFVDTLFSFLTLPMGTILRLLRDGKPHSHPVSIGSLGTLHEGLTNLDPKYFWTNDYCKNLLLKPRNSSECKCHKLKVTLDSRRYFRCDKLNCSRQGRSMFSPFNTDKCVCGKLMNMEICLEDSNGNKDVNKCGVFVPETATFIITDDLRVMPNSPGYSIEVLNGLGIIDMSVLEECSFTFGSKEFLYLLKYMLFSKTPLADLFFGEKAVASSEQVNMKITTSSISHKKMTLNLIVLKSSKKLLFCQANEDFIDFIFSFFAIPLGSVANLLGGNTCLGCVDNLYKSVSRLTAGRDIKSSDLKKRLINPQLAFPYLSKRQILSLKEDQITSQISCYFDDLKRLKFSTLSPYCDEDEFCTLEMKDARSNDGGFVRGPDSFMVTDDLVVTHYSSISALSFLDTLNIPFCDVEEQVVTIGKDEALSILKASLHTESALTNALNLFLKKPKVET